MASVIVAQAASQLTSTWLPMFAGIATLAAIVMTALRFRPEGESRLYGDAMRMVAELKEQLAEATMKLTVLQDALERERGERRAAEVRVGQLYARIDRLEARLGGRREEDD